MKFSAFALAGLLLAAPCAAAQDTDEAETAENQTEMATATAEPSCFITASGKTVRLLGGRSIQRLTRITPQAEDSSESEAKCTNLADFHGESQLRVFRGGQVAGLKTLDLSQVRRLQTRHISTEKADSAIIIARSRLQD